MSIDGKKDSETNELNSSTTQENTEKQSQDFFVTAPKKKFSALFVLSILGILLIGVMLFAYIYNIYGLRDFALKKTQAFHQTQPLKKTAKPITFPADTSEKTLTKPVQVLSSIEEKEKVSTYSTVSENASNHTDDKDIFSMNQSIVPVIDIQSPQDNLTPQEKPLEEILENSKTDIPQENTMNIVSETQKTDPYISTSQPLVVSNDNSDALTDNDSEQQEALRIQHLQKLNKIQSLHNRLSEYFFDLQSKLIAGEPYLTELIELKSELLRLDVPTLTEYASGGFPTEVLIMNEGIDALKRAAVSPYEHGQNKKEEWGSIFSRFAIITSDDKAGFNSDLGNIEKSLKDGDFIEARKTIRMLPASQQNEFKDVVVLLKDRETLFIELKKINRHLSDEIFSSVAPVR